jgi:hypothetical protein
MPRETFLDSDDEMDIDVDTHCDSDPVAPPPSSSSPSSMSATISSSSPGPASGSSSKKTVKTAKTKPKSGSKYRSKSTSVKPSLKSTHALKSMMVKGKNTSTTRTPATVESNKVTGTRTGLKIKIPHHHHVSSVKPLVHSAEHSRESFILAQCQPQSHLYSDSWVKGTERSSSTALETSRPWTRSVSASRGIGMGMDAYAQVKMETEVDSGYESEEEVFRLKDTRNHQSLGTSSSPRISYSFLTHSYLHSPSSRL